MKHQHGYKIGYRIHGSRLFIRTFITHTLPVARKMLHFYRKYGHRSSQNKRIKDVNYDIKPITKREILDGIWEEPPFLYSNLFHLSALGFLKSRFFHNARKLSLKTYMMPTATQYFSACFCLNTPDSLQKKLWLLRFGVSPKGKKDKKELNNVQRKPI